MLPPNNETEKMAYDSQTVRAKENFFQLSHDGPSYSEATLLDKSQATLPQTMKRYHLQSCF